MEVLNIRKLDEGCDFDMHRHPQRDAGCRSAAEAFLESFVRTHGHALVVFDHQGCGWKSVPQRKWRLIWNPVLREPVGMDGVPP